MWAYNTRTAVITIVILDCNFMDNFHKLQRFFVSVADVSFIESKGVDKTFSGWKMTEWFLIATCWVIVLSNQKSFQAITIACDYGIMLLIFFYGQPTRQKRKTEITSQWKNRPACDFLCKLTKQQVLPPISCIIHDMGVTWSFWTRCHPEIQHAVQRWVSLN